MRIGSVESLAKPTLINSDMATALAVSFGGTVFRSKTPTRFDGPPRPLPKPARAANRFHAERRFSQQNSNMIRRTPPPAAEKVRVPTDVSAEPEIGGDVDEGDLSGDVLRTTRSWTSNGRVTG
jgi:hypothetical protein